MSRPPIDGATVLLTGASSGIGLELAKLFALRSKCLVLVARRKERLEALADELTKLRPDLVVRVEPCDLGDVSEAEKLVGRLEADGFVMTILLALSSVTPRWFVRAYTAFGARFLRKKESVRA